MQSNRVLPLSSAFARTSMIDLASNQDAIGSCIGDKIVFTCTVTGSGTLLWAVESLFFDQSRISFDVSNDESGALVSCPFPDICNATLESAVQDPIHPLLGNLTSEITVTTLTLGKYVYCSNGSTFESISLIIKSVSK